MRPELEYFWEYLKVHCRGKANALKVGRLSWLLNHSERQIRAMAEELTTQHGHPIASTVHSPYGIYVAVTSGEREEYVRQLDSRIKALARRRRAFTAIPLSEAIRQMEMEYA